MEARMDAWKVEPKAFQPMMAMENAVRASGLEHSLIELVKTRASQINGCAYCLHMHTRDARKAGESETRLYVLSAWAESPLFSPRERAALAWTEALTTVAQGHPSDALYEDLRNEFTEQEIVRLTMLVVTINAWNRIAIGFHFVHPVEAEDKAAA